MPRQGLSCHDIEICSNSHGDSADAYNENLAHNHSPVSPECVPGFNIHEISFAGRSVRFIKRYASVAAGMLAVAAWFGLSYAHDLNDSADTTITAVSFLTLVLLLFVVVAHMFWRLCNGHIHLSRKTWHILVAALFLSEACIGAVGVGTIIADHSMLVATPFATSLTVTGIVVWSVWMIWPDSRETAAKHAAYPVLLAVLVVVFMVSEPLRSEAFDMSWLFTALTFVQFQDLLRFLFTPLTHDPVGWKNI